MKIVVLKNGIAFRADNTVFSIFCPPTDQMCDFTDARRIRKFMKEFMDTFIYGFKLLGMEWCVVAPDGRTVASFNIDEVPDAKDRACRLANELTIALHKEEDLDEETDR